MKTGFCFERAEREFSMCLLDSITSFLNAGHQHIRSRVDIVLSKPGCPASIAIV